MSIRSTKPLKDRHTDRISRIPPTRATGTFGAIVRYVLLVMIVMAVIYGFLNRASNAEVTLTNASEAQLFEYPASNYLYDQGVGFVHARDTNTYIILRSRVPGSEPPVYDYTDGFRTPEEVCAKLKEAGHVVSKVVFHNHGKLPPNNISEVTCR